MWRDDGDFTPFAPMPAEYEASELWDTMENIFFGPLARLLRVNTASEASNVNAVDEVPDSSWFTNRIGKADMSIAELSRGPCQGPPLDPAGPWTIVKGKPDGAHPGFTIKAADGRRYILKFDTGGDERPSSADVIGSLVYHAAGFHVPCNQVVFFHPSILQIDPKARAKDFVGDKVPLTQDRVDKAFERTVRLPDGRVRALASQFIDGRPIGPWVDFGVRPDDPNDVIPHQDRRELRGSYVLAAWLEHYDAREQNSLDAWIEVDPKAGFGWVKHYFIDFGDCFGSLSRFARVSRRRSVAYEVDFPILLQELVTFGVLPRRWHDPQLGPAGRILGYYNVKRFDPEGWRTSYPYGPFTRLTERDAAWMARILARFSAEDIVAMVDEAKISNPVVRSEIIRVMVGRRDKILRRYLGRLSPLTEPVIRGNQVCLRDTAVQAGIVRGRQEVCAELPDGSSGYHTISLAVRNTRPVRVHVRGRMVVGLER
ncbi:MAG: hypothetical protein MJE77_08990 [Proteobacteria bacterium]|nr:hypothetical protein [Pseudomonadota bacterium]